MRDAIEDGRREVRDDERYEYKKCEIGDERDERWKVEDGR